MCLKVQPGRRKKQVKRKLNREITTIARAWVDTQFKSMRFRNRSHAVEYALAKFLEQEKRE